ncbi:MAG: hypothetical protein WKF30_17760 [Pyrinomonadaceae bacterium]
MKLALIGYGAMNRSVHQHAQQAGLEVLRIFTAKDTPESVDELATELTGIDVAIDFSVADAVPAHASACARAGVALVEGTTGWGAHLDEVREIILRHHASCVYGANFSIGVNLFYRVAAHAAQLFAYLSSMTLFWKRLITRANATRLPAPRYICVSSLPPNSAKTFPWPAHAPATFRARTASASTRSPTK